MAHRFSHSRALCIRGRGVPQKIYGNSGPFLPAFLPTLPGTMSLFNIEDEIKSSDIGG